MAKRNIARSAIEGGRRSYCRWEEKQFTVSERRQASARLKRIICDRDYADELVIEERGQPYDLEFSDKLNPVFNWLCSRVGKPWNKTFSIICETFDRRSLAGRHIIEHIEGWVNMNHEGPYWTTSYGYSYPNWDFNIDEFGILRCNPFAYRSRRSGKHGCNT